MVPEYINTFAGAFRKHIAEDETWQEGLADSAIVRVYMDGSVFWDDDPTVAIEGPCEKLAALVKKLVSRKPKATFRIGE